MSYQCPDCGVKSDVAEFDYYSPSNSLLSGLPLMLGPFCKPCLEVKNAILDECIRVGATHSTGTTISLRRRTKSNLGGLTLFEVSFTIGHWRLERMFQSPSTKSAVRSAIQFAKQKGLRFRKAPATMLVRNFFTNKTSAVVTRKP